MDSAERLTAEHEELRASAFAIAYRMLGSVSDAEDIVQEGLLRLHTAAERAGPIASPRAFLATIVTRLCIDQLRSARVRREQYVGEWLPEPIVGDYAPAGDRVELAESLKDGDVRRGQKVFNGEKAACASCHAIGYLGGTSGPDLTRIGQVRTEHDLLESIVYPSITFVRSYEPMLVVAQTGEVLSGYLRKDAPDEVVLVTGPDKEARIPREDIVEMKLDLS